MVRTQIQLTEEQARLLKEIAHAEHISMAELIRRQVDTLIKAHKPHGRDRLVEQAKEACGKYGSGRSDISEDHDAYLSGDFLP
jgi:hypothetical protein